MAAQPITLFAAAAAAAAVILAVTTTALTARLLVLLFLLLALHLKLFYLANVIVILLVAAGAPTFTASLLARLNGSVGVVDPALIGRVRILVMGLPLSTVFALLLVRVNGLARLLTLARGASLLFGNLAVLRDGAAADCDALVLVEQDAVDLNGFGTAFQEAREHVQLAGGRCSMRRVILRKNMFQL